MEMQRNGKGWTNGGYLVCPFMRLHPRYCLQMSHALSVTSPSGGRDEIYRRLSNSHVCGFHYGKPHGVINANKLHRKSGDVGHPSIGYAERVLALAYSWEEADGSHHRLTLPYCIQSSASTRDSWHLERYF
jgi:hypothetical protein